MAGNGTGYPNKTAYLQGPTVNMTGTEEIRFHYHMYGANMGTLQLQAVSGSGGVTTLWTRSGDQGNSWFQQTIDLPGKSIVTIVGRELVDFRSGWQQASQRHTRSTQQCTIVGWR